MAKSRSNLVPFRPAQFRPIVIRNTKVVKPKKHHHSRKSSGGNRGLTDPKRMGIIVGGFAVGMIQKQGLPLPKLPFVGEAGTIGLAAYFLSDNGKNKLADEICTAALTIAAYELGNTGAIVGGEEVEGSTGGYVAGF
jgi:hypothetical protein